LRFLITWWLSVQSKLLVDQDTHQHTLATLKKAVSDQEALITRMQQVHRLHNMLGNVYTVSDFLQNPLY
jgi:hypothetical protein